MGKSNDRAEKAARARALLFGGPDSAGAAAGGSGRGSAPAPDVGRSHLPESLPIKPRSTVSDTKRPRPAAAPADAGHDGNKGDQRHADSSAVERFVRDEIDPRWYPKHPHGSLKRGDSVWYRGERYWVEHAPDHWSKSVHVRISSKPIHPDPERPVGNERESFCCHGDMLTLAPQNKNIYGRQPTLAGLAQKERAKAGMKDVGDPVAEALRGCPDIEAVYKFTARCLGCTAQELRDRYAHLNPGQQRMNCGNRLRAAVKKGGVEL